jgi:2-polyprenyl-3-methyl-5-hydroxy-6-metoxy-1,4-benzoquinol methylase
MSEDTGRYQREWRPDTAHPNDSLQKMFNLVTANSRVLDIGCSIGQLGAALVAEKACHVTGIDYNHGSIVKAKERLSRALCADITKESLASIFPGEKFDFIIFADVLEHLLDPVAALLDAHSVLDDQGLILISVPNISHASVRLALLEGRFEYREQGLLDRSHLTFFTKDFLYTVLSASNLTPIEVDATYLGAQDTEIEIKEQGIITKDLIRTVEREPDATIYQFIVQAAPVGHAQLKESVIARLKNTERTILSLTDENSQLRLEVAGSYDVKDLVNQLEARVNQLEARVNQLEARVNQQEGQHLEHFEKIDSVVSTLKLEVEILSLSLSDKIRRWLRNVRITSSR